MDHVDGLERDERRRRPGVVADRDVQLVGGHDAQPRIADLPPPLVPHDGHVHRIGRRGVPLDGEDVAGRGQEQDDDDEEWYDRPRQLDLRTAVHLRGVASVLARAAPVAHDGVERHAGDDDEDERDHREHQE